MSRSRLAAAAVLAVLATTAPAYAAKAKPKPKPVCNLVKDAPGDAFVATSAAGPTTYDPSLDIVSADINVNATMLTGVIRVKDLTQESQAAATGRVWNLTMSNGTQAIGLKAYLSPLGKEQFSRGLGKFDYAADQVRIHAKIADLTEVKLPKGTVLRNFSITTNYIVGFDPAWGAGFGLQPQGGAVDATQPSAASFKVGSLSCVKVGV
jgi:hypothetical protein